MSFLLPTLEGQRWYLLCLSSLLGNLLLPPSLHSLYGVLLLAEGNEAEHLPNTCHVS